MTPSLLFCAPMAGRVPRTTRRGRSTRDQAHAAQKRPADTRALTPDQQSSARAALRVTQRLPDTSAATSLQLLAYTEVKGISPPRASIWRRAQLEQAIAAYTRNERLCRLQPADVWRDMAYSKQISVLHAVCNAEGDVTYTDPKSGYTVFSYFAHLKRGSCCGIAPDLSRLHRCRHCPYTQDGRLQHPSLIALQLRIPVIEAVREQSQQLSNFEDDVSDPTQITELSAPAQPAAPSSPRMRTVVVADNGLTKLIRLEKPTVTEATKCHTCADLQWVTCTRCSGWTYLFSPRLMKCPQCSANGYHKCFNCTTFRPPAKSSFYH